MDLTNLDPVERLLAEHAVASAREVRRAMDGAAHGHGLEVTERAALEQGRKHTALMMEEMLKARAAAEEKGGAPAGAARGRATGTRPG